MIGLSVIALSIRCLSSAFQTESPSPLNTFQGDEKNIVDRVARLVKCVETGVGLMSSS